MAGRGDIKHRGLASGWDSRRSTDDRWWATAGPGMSPASRRLVLEEETFRVKQSTPQWAGRGGLDELGAPRCARRTGEHHDVLDEPGAPRRVRRTGAGAG